MSAQKHYGADDVIACRRCGTGRMRVGRRTPDFAGDPKNEIQTLRCSACGDETQRIVDAAGHSAPNGG